MSCIHRSQKLMDCISTYDSPSLVSLGPVHEDVNATKWQLLRLTGTVSLLHIISQSQDFQHWLFSPYKLQKIWLASIHSCINLGRLCNLRLDYSKTFRGVAWLHVALTTPPMPSQGALIYSAIIQKSCLWEHKRFSIKFL